METMELLELDPRYSTTRRLSKVQPLLGSAGIHTKRLFVSENHPCHGGLRTQGYFKPCIGNKPIITVITAVINGKNELESTLNSVLEQSYKGVEYIVVDGGSTDGTVDILKGYNYKLDYWVSEPDRGISDAWNKAISLANGQYLSFLNAGDEYLPGALKNVAEKIEPFDFSWGDMFWIDESGNANLYRGRNGYREVIDYVMPFNHPTMFFKRSLVQKVSGYDTTLRLAMDYDLVRKLVKNGGNGVHVNVAIAKMRAGGVHDRNYRATVAEVRRIAVSHGTNWVSAWLGERYTLLKHSGDRTPMGQIMGRLASVAKGVKRCLQSIS